MSSSYLGEDCAPGVVEKARLAALILPTISCEEVSSVAALYDFQKNVVVKIAARRLKCIDIYILYIYIMFYFLLYIIHYYIQITYWNACCISDVIKWKRRSMLWDGWRRRNDLVFPGDAANVHPKPRLHLLERPSGLSTAESAEIFARFAQRGANCCFRAL